MGTPRTVIRGLVKSDDNGLTADKVLQIVNEESAVLRIVLEIISSSRRPSWTLARRFQDQVRNDAAVQT